MAKIDILLATYNGGRYLTELVDSVLSQTNNDWSLLIRDDGSVDNTLSIITDFVEKYPTQFSVLPGSNINLGVIDNFDALLHATDADYILFCDQDDVWLPNKIELALQEMHRLESKFGIKHPILVHTDAKVVNNDLQIKANSFWRYQHIDPVAGVNLNRLLVQNVVTGCTVMINSQLRDIALPLPSSAIMHDWWLALVATVFGTIGHVSEPTVLYRQHRENQVGAGNVNLSAFFERLWSGDEVNRFIASTQFQAKLLLERYQNSLSPHQSEILFVYSSLSQLGFFLRRYYRLKYGFLYSRFIHNVGRILAG